MRLKVDTDDSRQEVKLIEKESLFLKDFIAYWKVIRDHRTKKIDEINEVCKSLYEDYTRPFTDKWGGQLGIINPDTHNLEEYYSFEFTFPTGNTILVPHKILVFESLRPTETVYHFLRRIKNFREFLFYFERTCRDANFRLNKNDVQILQMLSTDKFTGVSEKLPKIEDLAKICNCDPQTYRRRIKRLEDTYILTHVYLIDLAKIGYETFISISKNIHSTTGDYYLANTPYNTSIINWNTDSPNNYRTVISQIPFSRSDVYRTIKNQPDTILWQKLSHAYFGNNLSSLTPSVESRWKIMPPILSIMSWDDLIVSANPNNGITFNLTPESDPYQLSSNDVRVLSIFEDYWYLSTNVEIAKKTGISEKSIRKVWSRISDMNLVKRFASVRNIGLGIKPWISVIGHDPISQGPIIDRIVEHLKLFPFSWLFYDVGDLDKGTRPIIVGLIYLPSSWVIDFFVKFNLLSDYGFSAQISLSRDRSIKWNINVSKTL